MSQVWSVMINGKDPASFDPDVYGTEPGQPLKAQVGDLVCWNNQTMDVHQIAIQSATPFTTKVIGAYGSSQPGYCIQSGDPKTLTYNCTKHSNETGTITVVTS